MSDIEDAGESSGSQQALETASPETSQPAESSSTQEAPQANATELSLQELTSSITDMRKELEENRSGDHSRAEVLQQLHAENQRIRRQRLLDSGAIIAIAALIFSLASFLIDRNRVNEEAELEARKELSQLVQQINDIPIDLAVLYAQVGPAAAAGINGSLNSRQSVLIGQAERLISQYPDQVTALDYSVLGNGYLLESGTQAAKSAYQNALNKLESSDQVAAGDSDIDLTAHRGLAYSHFVLGEPEIGRDLYRQALMFEQRYPEATENYIEFSAILTRLNWALTEMNVFECPAAAEQFHLLEEAAQTTDAPGLYTGIGTQIQQHVTAFQANCPTIALSVDRLMELATFQVESVGAIGPAAAAPTDG